MRKPILILALLSLVTPAIAQNYQLGSSVISSGGGHSESSNYSLDGTIGQPIIGEASSPNFIVQGGFWPGTLTLIGGCEYITGDINDNGQPNGIDVVYGVGYFKGGPPPPLECDCPGHGVIYAAGDVNGNCAFNGIDITYYVTYLKGGSPLSFCGDCPPSGVLAGLPGAIPTVVNPMGPIPKLQVNSHPRTVPR
jgi:hypothetical protein